LEIARARSTTALASTAAFPANLKRRTPAEIDDSFPHAITLGPSSILRSRIAGEIEVSRHLAGGRYISYFNDNLLYHGEHIEHPDVYNEEVAIAIIRDAAESVYKDLNTRGIRAHTSIYGTIRTSYF
jgi:hypothetical protein